MFQIFHKTHQILQPALCWKPRSFGCSREASLENGLLEVGEKLCHLSRDRHVPLHVWPLHGGHHFTGDMQHQHKHKKQPTMRGRHFKTNSMSQYIGSGQKKRFDVRIKELVSKAQNPGPFLRKDVF